VLRKLLVLSVTLVLIAGFFAGCAQKAEEPEQPAAEEEEEAPEEEAPAAEEADKFGGTLRYAMMANPPTLDPRHATDTSSSTVNYNMFEMLVDLDPDGNLIPLLAESWEGSGGGTVFTFHLRKGVHFHDTIEGGKPTANGGREVTADDWVWTFNHLCDPETACERAYFIDMVKGYDEYREGKADSLEGVKKLDDYTIQIETTYPFAPFVSVLAYNTFVVLPREDVEKWGDQFNFNPVGTGPFKFDSWVQDDRLLLVRNDNYWEKDDEGNALPYLDAIEFRIVPDLSMMWTEFTMGNFETIDSVDDPYYYEAKDKYGDSFHERPWCGTYYYGMNQELEPFKGNKQLRKALNYAIDRETLIELVCNGRATPAKGVLPPGMFAYNPNLEGYEFNPDKAKSLLAEAGYPDGVKLTLQYNTSDGHKRRAEAIQQQYKQIGIDMELFNVDWGAHLDSVERGEVSFFRMGWVVDYMDPDNFLYVLLNSENIGPQGNYSRYNNPKFDELTKQARLETDPKVREQLYKEAEQLVVDDAPWVFIYHYTSHQIVQPYVKGYVLPSLGDYASKWKYVWMEAH